MRVGGPTIVPTKLPSRSVRKKKRKVDCSRYIMHQKHIVYKCMYNKHVLRIAQEHNTVIKMTCPLQTPIYVEFQNFTPNLWPKSSTSILHLRVLSKRIGNTKTPPICRNLRELKLQTVGLCAGQLFHHSRCFHLCWPSVLRSVPYWWVPNAWTSFRCNFQMFFFFTGSGDGCRYLSYIKKVKISTHMDFLWYHHHPKNHHQDQCLVRFRIVISTTPPCCCALIIAQLEMPIVKLVFIVDPPKKETFVRILKITSRALEKGIFPFK